MNKIPTLLIKATSMLAALALSAGCATYSDLPAGTVRQIPPPANDSAVVERQIESLPPLSPEPAPPAEYQIGTGDLISISVFGRPELGSSNGSGSAGSGQAIPQGSRVDENGAVRLPLVGAVAVAGLTAAQAEAKLRASYSVLLKEPWVSVVVAEHRSRPLYLFGLFNKPGVFYMDRPLNLLQGIALAEGFSSGAALRSARLTRNSTVLPVDIYELLANGDQRQNVWLRSGDAIYLPDKTTQQVFVFGSVQKSGAIPMLNGELSLAQAIASADPRQVGYDNKHVRIIRSLSTTKGELLVVDLDRIMRGEAPPFMLTNGDIVYLPRSAMGSWNDAISEILPSLQAVSSILQPFVSIKYLSD
jgi:polysaccharide export outer membrane protein